MSNQCAPQENAALPASPTAVIEPKHIVSRVPRRRHQRAPEHCKTHEVQRKRGRRMRRWPSARTYCCHARPNARPIPLPPQQSPPGQTGPVIRRRITYNLLTTYVPSTIIAIQPSIAQLEERQTVMDTNAIWMSLVRSRLEGFLTFAGNVYVSGRFNYVMSIV